jgi:hypothetical protein
MSMNYDMVDEDLEEIPWDNFGLKGVDTAMGELPVPGADFYELQYDEETGQFTDEQEEAVNEYEDAYWRLMKAGGELIEAFGYRAQYS